MLSTPSDSANNLADNPSSLHGGVGLSDPSYSQSRRKMLDLINRLHGTGYVRPMLMGKTVTDQSCAKVCKRTSIFPSSLLLANRVRENLLSSSPCLESLFQERAERVPGFYFNFYLSTLFSSCRRCPTECRLSYSTQPWKCLVYLQHITDERGQTLGQARKEPFGEAIFDKAEVEERIRRAQRAILNPSQDARHFLTGQDEDPSVPDLSFSMSYVSLHISSSDVEDLSFVDLPGNCFQ